MKKALIKLLPLLFAGVLISLGIVFYIESRPNQVAPTSQPTATPANVTGLFASFPLNKARLIDFRVDGQALSRMSRRQQEDQMRDWLLITVVSSSGLPANDLNRTLYDLPVYRHGYLQSLGNFEYGVSRSRYIGSDRLVALLPSGLPENQRKDELGRIADEHRKNTGTKPASVIVFEYELNLEQQYAQLTLRSTLDGSLLFGPEYNYYETQVDNLDGLAQFANTVNDITFATRSGAGLILGGRRLSGRQYEALRLEDVAAIWQSENQINAPLQAVDAYNAKVRALNARVDDFNAICTKNGAKKDQFDPQWCSRESDQLAQAKQQLDDEARALEQIKSSAQAQVKGSGFSLDPTYDYSGLVTYFAGKKSFLQKLASGKNAPITPGDLQAAERGLASGDEHGLLVLLDKLSKSQQYADTAEQLSEEVRQNYQFQAARYDGTLKGTEVGMVLFYTDLLAKLWALDYQGSSPSEQAIPDFKAMTKTQVSAIYAQEMEALSNTRLWFGPRDKGFQVTEGGLLLFGHRATRLYAASSNPLEPGKEVEPNPASAAFLGWWDDHYDELAAYEPKYERLNAIMKWSLLVSWLNQAGEGSTLGFLQNAPVTMGNWFPGWVCQHPELIFRRWACGQSTASDAQQGLIAFYAQGYKGAHTEAMPLISSEPFQQFGKTWTLSGGVSLADVDTFKARVPLPATVDEFTARPNLDFSQPASTDTVRTADHKVEFKFGTLPGDVPNVTASSIGQGDKLRDTASELTKGSYERSMSSQTITAPNSKGNSTRFDSTFANTPLGTLAIDENANGFAARWTPRDVDVATSLAEEFSRSHDPPVSIFQANDQVETIVQIGTGDEYWIRLRDSSQWLHLMKASQPNAGDLNGWMGRVSEPVNGAREILVNVSTQSPTADNANSYIVIAAEPKGLWRITADSPPNGLTNVTIETGFDAVKVQVDPTTRTLYFCACDLPQAIKGDLARLRSLLGPAGQEDLVSLVSQPNTGPLTYNVRPTNAGSPGLIDEIAARNYPLAARQIAQDPQRARLALVQELHRVDTISTARPNDALTQLEDLSTVYGNSPDICARKALIELEQGKVRQAANTMSQVELRPLLDIGILSETSKPMGNNKQITIVTDANNYEAHKDSPDGIYLPIANGPRLVIELRQFRPLSGVPVTDIVGSRYAIYAQDVPALADLDSPVPIISTVKTLTTGGDFWLRELPDPAIGYFRPSAIYDSDGIRYKLVSASPAGSAAFDQEPYKPYSTAAPVSTVSISVSGGSTGQPSANPGNSSVRGSTVIAPLPNPTNASVGSVGSAAATEAANTGVQSENRIRVYVIVAAKK